jgi:DNA-binding FadR family transcriptional regulator
VEQRWIESKRQREFAVYRNFLPGSQIPSSYPQAAAELGVAEGAARTAVSRLRAELGAALRHQIGLTVSTPEEVEAEMNYLRTVLGSPSMDMAASR